MEQRNHKLIALANQPHEAVFIAPIMNEILRLSPGVELSLAFTDYYVFVSQQNFLKGIEAGFPGEVTHLGEVYKSWQEEIGEPAIDLAFLDNWEKNNCFDRTLEELEKTNQLLFLDERSQWHMPISDAWKKKVLIDTIKWCEDYIDRYRPSIFVSVGNATLVTNIFYTISKNRNIPFYSFLPSRIGNRIITRDDFGYGMSDALFERIHSLSEDPKLRQDALIIAGDIASQSRGSYESYQAKISDDFSLKQSKLLGSLFSDFRRLAGQIYARIFIQKRLYAFPIRRINEDLVKLTFYDLKRIFSHYLRSAGLFNYGASQVPDKKYFLWALHMRPEGAVSTLGDGRDEIAELLRCAELLPDGFFMAVKENPEMFTQRKRGFHRKLKKHSKIILMDPYSPIFPLIESSIGVIGISGTVLLEAAILNKPTCALGHPEFDRFLTEHGWESAHSFIEKCVAGFDVDALDKFLPYLIYVIETTNEHDTPPWHDWLSEFGANEIKETQKRLAERIVQTFH